MDCRTKRRRGYTRLSGKHQVTIPLGILADLGLSAGAVLRVETIDGTIVLRPDDDPATRRRRALEELAGSLTGVFEPGYLRKLRDEWR